MKNQPYNDDPITALSARESVRLRPAMYFGSTGWLGLHGTVFESIGFLAFDFFKGNGRELQVSLNRDGSVTVTSDWTDIPAGISEIDKLNRTFLELEVTQLFAPGKYFLPDCLAGIAPVNFVSETFEIEIHRDGGVFVMAFERGIPVKPVMRGGNSPDRKTRIRFTPDSEIFSETAIDFEKVLSRLRALACLLPGFSFILEDLRDGAERREVVNYKNGVADHVSWLTTGRETILAKPFFTQIYGMGRSSGEKSVLEIAFQYVGDEVGEMIFSLANGWMTEQGGTHVAVFKAGLMTSHSIRKDSDRTIAPERLLKGLVAVVSAKIPTSDLRFHGAKHAELASDFSENFVIRLHDAIELYFEENPGAAKRLRTHFKH